ncbi:polyphosphate kinase 2 [Pelagibacterium luteolum]|uniref:ADP/GDP-polyphosphate phosphotransferase n=1 Tax=Pelagibacterium luteolum TaxID=440168 RepID=A0A1G7XP28_9HYPH|nr:polyphosphate kinase 2 [Pelagibacterium luteolum]SDG85861.1 polyphosphate kinase 2, PA0141 family [Pelagibacterium luteolum]
MAKFDLEDPELDPAIKDAALTSGGFPYDEKMKSKAYDKQLRALQIELVKLQSHLQASGERVLALFEGRDSAGKGGTIKRFLENLNPRNARTVALPKPSDRETSQWYFQRYVTQLPSGGEIALFDRSWYNRAVVEPVMGFCTPQQTASFLREAPPFERMITEEGIHVFKFWLEIGREMQLKRFHDRRHDPVKVWKLSPVDLVALDKWDEYTQARNTMFIATDTPDTPWIVIRANDKKRARIAAIQSVLWPISYKDKDFQAIGEIDDKIVMSPEAFLTRAE